jgi:hypothetical protein
MGRKYTGQRWAVDLPVGYQARLDGDCTLIASEDRAGLLQIRDFRSGGRDIDDDDLRELADQHAEGGATLFRVRYGKFSGFYVHYRAEDDLWYEWWLRSGKVAVHATYHHPVDELSTEEATIAVILGSLEPVEDS